jgi:hydrogenase expression/formation protein HypE
MGRDLVRDHIAARFSAAHLAGLPDAASIRAGGADLLFTTDSYVVSPAEFPGGNIGHLAVHGTVNDLAVSGARPLFLSLGLILEEGLPVAVLDRVLQAMQTAAREAGVRVVTGDTKVVPHGAADGLYLNTAGIGERLPGFALEAAGIREGDAVLASGSLGDHGMAVMAARHNLGRGDGPASDTASVFPLVEAAVPYAPAVRFMRDPTRGGAAGVLNELVEDRDDIGIMLDEAAVPFSRPARAVAEVLGLDLLQSACEGRLLLVCAPEAADPLLAAWRALPGGAGAACIGRVACTPGLAGRVAAVTLTGGRRMVDQPRGELLPRIC